NANCSPGSAEPRFGGGDVLVRNVDLLFEHIEVGIAECLPPVAAQAAVLWFGLLPLGAFFKAGRDRSGGCVVMRADLAGRQQQYTGTQSHKSRVPHAFDSPGAG